MPTRGGAFVVSRRRSPVVRARVLDRAGHRPRGEAKRASDGEAARLRRPARGGPGAAGREPSRGDAPRRGGKRRATLYDYALDVKRRAPAQSHAHSRGGVLRSPGVRRRASRDARGAKPHGHRRGSRAPGCPLVKVQETLDRLTHRGFAVVVCEEVPSMNPYGQRAPPKERYVAAVITPASPQYVVGAADAGDDVAFDGALRRRWWRLRDRHGARARRRRARPAPRHRVGGHDRRVRGRRGSRPAATRHRSTGTPAWTPGSARAAAPPPG